MHAAANIIYQPFFIFSLRVTLKRIQIDFRCTNLCKAAATNHWCFFHLVSDAQIKLHPSSQSRRRYWNQSKRSFLRGSATRVSGTACILNKQSLALPPPNPATHNPFFNVIYSVSGAILATYEGNLILLRC